MHRQTLIQQVTMYFQNIFCLNVGQNSAIFSAHHLKLSLPFVWKNFAAKKSQLNEQELFLSWCTPYTEIGVIPCFHSVMAVGWKDWNGKG